MKKQFALIAACTIILSSCGTKTEPAQTSEASSEAANVEATEAPKPATPEESAVKTPEIDTSAAEALLKGVDNTYEALSQLVAGDADVTETQYEALLLQTTKCETFDDENAVCPARTVLTSFDINERNIQNKDAVLRKMAHHPDVRVRTTVYLQMGNVCENPENGVEILHIVEKETDFFALAMGLEAFKECSKQYPVIINRALEAATSQSKQVRNAAVYALSGDPENPKVIETMKKLLDDTDSQVVQSACMQAGGFYNDDLVPAIAEHLTNKFYAKQYYYSCTHALTQMWLDFPNHAHHSQAAFDATVKFLEEAEFNSENTPLWSILDLLTPQNSDTLTSWKENSPWVQTDALANAVMHLALNEKDELPNRLSAVNVIKTYGSNKALKTLEKGLKADKSENGKRLLEALKSNM